MAVFATQEHGSLVGRDSFLPLSCRHEVCQEADGHAHGPGWRSSLVSNHHPQPGYGQEVILCGIEMFVRDI